MMVFGSSLVYGVNYRFLKMQRLSSLQVGLGGKLVSSLSRTLQYHHNCFAVFLITSFTVDAMTLY